MSTLPSRKEVEFQFEVWRRQHGLEFASAEEQIQRLDVFEANNRMVTLISKKSIWLFISCAAEYVYWSTVDPGAQRQHGTLLDYESQSSKYYMYTYMIN